ncbi:unnamed protein product [Protopolystoma xenopodis]|uniref:UBC core domain-containing protein n=1 Tax=Protopolystoma xenopodis TaxID=117903 RepID=A0A3S5CLW6_9PLAT|nr:unnamed protein product [Protopolystoma xenopodis]
MSSIAGRRIKRELIELMKSSEVNASLNQIYFILQVAQNQIEIKSDGDNIMHLLGTIVGPPDTPYEGAKYELDIVIPDNYPFVPPKLFEHFLWINKALCLNRAAAMSLRTILLSIQALLALPEPDDPQDAVVASQYKSDRNKFLLTARHWAAAYADGPHIDPYYKSQVEKMVQMGFDEVRLYSYMHILSYNTLRLHKLILLA